MSGGLKLTCFAEPLFAIGVPLLESGRLRLTFSEESNFRCFVGWEAESFHLRHIPPRGRCARQQELCGMIAEDRPVDTSVSTGLSCRAEALVAAIFARHKFLALLRCIPLRRWVPTTRGASMEGCSAVVPGCASGVAMRCPVILAGRPPASRLHATLHGVAVDASVEGHRHLSVRRRGRR
jgi:hypothetical protein